VALRPRLSPGVLFSMAGLNRRINVGRRTGAVNTARSIEFATLPQRWPRAPPRLAWRPKCLPTYWVPEVERHPEGVRSLPGYVWLDMPGKVRSVGAHELEFRDDPPTSDG
jgi:hypothetical protein